MEKFLGKTLILGLMIFGGCSLNINCPRYKVIIPNDYKIDSTLYNAPTDSLDIYDYYGGGY